MTWMMQSITIKTTHGDASVSAEIFGDWAAHPRRNTEDGVWQVTHIPSGRGLGQAFTELQLWPDRDAAIAIAKALQERVPVLRYKPSSGDTPPHHDDVSAIRNAVHGVLTKSMTTRRL